jgi:hypothetical protein
VLRRVTVTDHGKPIPPDQLNELEYVHGQIYANLWHTDRIARISPATGKVLGYINLAGLLPDAERSSPEAVLNGIAYDSEHDRLFVTGKLWPKIFEIKVIPEKPSVAPARAGSSRGHRNPMCYPRARADHTRDEIRLPAPSVFSTAVR